MATRSYIALKQGEADSYDAVYCHFDGYPTGVGKTLKENYTDPKIVQLLLEGGSISTLHPNLEDVIFYHKWRGDPLVVQRKLPYEELKRIARDSWAEYMYIFDSSNTWITEEL